MLFFSLFLGKKIASSSSSVPENLSREKSLFEKKKHFFFWLSVRKEEITTFGEKMGLQHEKKKLEGGEQAKKITTEVLSLLLVISNNISYTISPLYSTPFPRIIYIKKKLDFRQQQK